MVILVAFPRCFSRGHRLTALPSAALHIVVHGETPGDGEGGCFFITITTIIIGIYVFVLLLSLLMLSVRYVV